MVVSKFVIMTKPLKKPLGPKYGINKHDIIEYDGHKLYGITALRDFGDVKNGQAGGYIEDGKNLSHEGNCWIYPGAMVFEDALVFGCAKVKDHAIVRGKAFLCGNCEVSGDAIVTERANIRGYAKICQSATVYGMALVEGHSIIDGTAHVSDWVQVRGHAKIGGAANVNGRTIINGTAVVT